MLEAQIRQLVETNLKLTNQLGNLWDELGSKNDYIREQKFELAAAKVERDEWKSKWSRCVAKKWERQGLEENKKKREEDRALIEKSLTDERTDN